MLLGVVNAQFGNLFEHMFRQQSQEPPNSRNQVPEGSNLVEFEYDRGRRQRRINAI